MHFTVIYAWQTGLSGFQRFTIKSRTEVLNKIYVQAYFDMTPLFADSFFKRSQKTCLAFLAADLCMRLAKKHQFDIKIQLLRVEQSLAHHPVLPLIKASAVPYDRQHKSGDTHVQVCQMCKTVQGRNSIKLRKSQLLGWVPALQMQSCSLTVTGAFINILT